ncbi:keywimysin-related RiPP [Nonomuraea endophytica]
MRTYERPTLIDVGSFELKTDGWGGPNWEWYNSWGL